MEHAQAAPPRTSPPSSPWGALRLSGFWDAPSGTYVETEENRRALLRGPGLEGSGGGAPGPGGGVLGKCERLTGLEETPPRVGVFQVASRSPRVPSLFHSFRRSLDTSLMLISVSGAGAAEIGTEPRSPVTCQRLSPFICSRTTRTRGETGVIAA
jgi:hypothetical protein